jgi:predicted naringenin-chalcone synthase
LANIVSIATAVPQYRHEQKSILQFMQTAYNLNETDKRKLSFLYAKSGIQTRHSVIEDYGVEAKDWKFIPNNTDAFPLLEKRIELYQQHALPISKSAIEKCIEGKITAQEITHLITVSCTGMAAPGLDLALMEALNLETNIYRTSINFMGCYAAIHALKIATDICHINPKANVVLVCTELCTLHFQKEYTEDNAASSLLFADGCAAVFISNTIHTKPSISLNTFYSKVSFKGKQDMSWQLSSKGFLMSLTGYVPQLIEEDIETLLLEALEKQQLQKHQITHWCIHPGGKKIVDNIQRKLGLTDAQVQPSRNVLSNYGNMSSATILFVLQQMMEEETTDNKVIFGIAFGPGLTMETFIATQS